MKILIVSKDPTHRTTAGNRWGILKQAEMLRSLGNEVHFLYVRELPLRHDGLDVYAADLKACTDYWGEFLHVFNVSKLQKAWFNILYRLRKWFCGGDCGIDDDYPCGLSGYVRALQAEQQFDICIVNYYYLTKLLTQCSIPVKAVFTHDYFAHKNLVVGENILHINPGSESVAMQRAPHIFAVQDDECSYYRLISPRSEVYNIYSLYEYHPQPVCGNHDIVFLSGGNQFNINGIRSFVADVFPSVHDKYPDARLLIGGSICSRIKDLGQIDGVELEGYVDDTAAFYARADVAVNPVYQGTGLKIKTFEAVSYDKITLVHPHSARGIFCPGSAPVKICASPADWLSAFDEVWSGRFDFSGSKEQNGEYINALSQFVRSEYLRFLDNAAKQ